MLKSINIKNFKSYLNHELPLAPLTLMIGANASVKSNALEAFRFLSWLSQGQKLTVLKHRVDDSEQDVTDIEFFQDRRGKISLELVETFGGKERKWSVELLFFLIFLRVKIQAMDGTPFKYLCFTKFCSL